MEYQLSFKEAQQYSSRGTFTAKSDRRLTNPKTLYIEEISVRLGLLGLSEQNIENIKRIAENIPDEIITKKNINVLTVALIYKETQGELTKEKLEKFATNKNYSKFYGSPVDLIRYVELLK